MLKPESARRYLSFYVFGFADFVVAVGTGLIFTLLQDPRMGLIAVLPMALISAASPLAYRSFFEEFLIPAANAAGVPI